MGRASLIVAVVMVVASVVPVVASAGSIDGWMAIETMVGEEVVEMDSEINRRILQSSQHISYGALSRNFVPCSIPGAPYYDCRPAAQGNYWNRGCQKISWCKRGGD